MAGNKIPTYLQKICGMLEDECAEYKCSAAIVLGELGIKDSFVVGALGQHLTNGEDEKLKGHILSAFKKIKAKESLRFLLPFLLETKDTNHEFYNLAITIASSLGSEAATELKKMLKKAEDQERRIIISIFIKMQTVEGLKVVLDFLKNNDVSMINEICVLMKEGAKELTQEKRKSFSKKIEHFLLDKKIVKNRHSISAAVKILGYIGSSGVYPTLLSFTNIQNHPVIRSQALVAMSRLTPKDKPQTDVIKKLISYLEDDDFSNIVSPTLNILAGINFPTRMADLMIRLMNNRHETVKRFTVKKMRELNSPKIVNVLIKKLQDPDPSIRDIAAESLCWLDAARKVLLENLLAEENIDLCWLYAKILKPHASKIRSKQVGALIERLNELMDQNSILQDPLLFIIRIAAPDSLTENLLARALTFKKNKGYDQAIRTLEIVRKYGHLGVDGTYELAVNYLKMSPKNESWRDRESDPCIPLFQQILKNSDFALLDELLKDKTLDRGDLYYVAFHFMGKLKKEREFGRELLEHLIKKHPRTKEGRASKKLLKASE